MPVFKHPPVIVIACKAFNSILEAHIPPRIANSITFLEYGLHRFPSKLKQTLQQSIDSIETPSRILLGYGLCGNGLHGIMAGKHTLIVPRAHDCIAILLGSYQNYLREFQSQPGTYYLTKGWLECGSHPLNEYLEYEQKYGSQRASWIMDQQYKNYTRLVLVAHNQADLEKYRPKAIEVARYCQRWGMRYQEILGTDGYIKQLIEVVKDPDKADEDILVIPPGGELTQEMFLR